MPSQFMDEHEMNGTTIPVEKVLFKPSLSNVQPMWHSSLSKTTGINWAICWDESFFQRRFNSDFLLRGHREISLAMRSSEGCDVVSSCHVESEHLPSGRPSTAFKSNETISWTGKYGQLPLVWHERDHYCRVWNLTIVFPISNTCFNVSMELFLPKMSSTIDFCPPMQKVKSSKRWLFASDRSNSSLISALFGMKNEYGQSPVEKRQMWRDKLRNRYVNFNTEQPEDQPIIEKSAKFIR